MKKNYITIDQVSTDLGKSRRTIVEWCKEGFIRGAYFDADIDDYAIPKNYKEPYMLRGKPKGDGIYISIVKGIVNGYDVCAKLYSIGESEFEEYMKELIESNIVAAFKDKDTGIVYYKQTIHSSDFSKLRKNKVRKFLVDFKPDISLNISP